MEAAVAVAVAAEAVVEAVEVAEAVAVAVAEAVEEAVAVAVAVAVAGRRRRRAVEGHVVDAQSVDERRLAARELSEATEIGSLNPARLLCTVVARGAVDDRERLRVLRENDFEVGVARSA